MARFKDQNWNCGNGPSVQSIDHANLAVLMDIRDELKRLNNTLECHNVRGGMVALQQLNKRAAKHWPLRAKAKL